MKVRRGDIVLLPISFVSGVGSKVRPAVVVQSDSLNTRLNSTVVAIITSTNLRAAIEPTQVLVDLNTPDGQRTGLLRTATIKAEHLDTVDQRDIRDKLGELPRALMLQLEVAIKAALLIH